MIQPIVMAVDAEFPLERRRLPDDPELAPDSSVIGTYIGDSLVARCAGPADWGPESDMGLFDAPRQVQYSGVEGEDGTIRAELGALIPAADMPREPWEAEPDEDVPPLLFPLGVIIRIPADRTGTDLVNECAKHLLAVLTGGGEPVVDRILKRL